MRVHVTRPIPRAGFRLLEEAGLEVSVPREAGPPARGELLKAVRDCHGLLSLLTEKIDAELMDAAPRLKVISNHAVGHDNVDVGEATRRGIAVTNTPGVLTETVADFTWALMLAVARRVVEADHFLRAGRFDAWGPLMLLGSDVHGATLGVLGAGRIGLAVARRAAGFRMKVLLCSRTRHLDRPDELGLLRHAQWVEIDELLERSDFITLHVNYHSRTHHLIDAGRIARMRRGSYLINTARGPVVDEQALVQALRSGHLAGAALDVYEREPEVTAGLTDLPNVVLAPHIASATVATRDRMATMAATNLIRALRGQRPDHLVNPQVWTS